MYIVFFKPLGSNHLPYSNCLSLMCVRWDRFLCRHIHLFCHYLVKVVCYINDIMRSGYACFLDTNVFILCCFNAVSFVASFLDIQYLGTCTCTYSGVTNREKTLIFRV